MANTSDLDKKASAERVMYRAWICDDPPCCIVDCHPVPSKSQCLPVVTRRAYIGCHTMRGVQSTPLHNTSRTTEFVVRQLRPRMLCELVTCVTFRAWIALPCGVRGSDRITVSTTLAQACAFFIHELSRYTVDTRGCPSLRGTVSVLRTRDTRGTT
jgi:hypothetical protein